jgi:hypothetical protein
MQAGPGQVSQQDAQEFLRKVQCTTEVENVASVKGSPMILSMRMLYILSPVIVFSIRILSRDGENSES